MMTIGRQLLRSRCKVTAMGLGIVTMVVAPAVQSCHAQTFSVLYGFTGGADGGQPQGPLFLQNQQLLGITPLGGSAAVPNGFGTIFSIGISPQQETTLYTFAEEVGSYSAYTGVVSDSAGNIYGVTPLGGADNDGTVFELSPAGNMTILHSFSGPDGAMPSGSLVLDSNGNLFGATITSNTHGVRGTVFKLEITTGSFITLHRFRGGQDGSDPTGSLLLEHGELYGTTETGGQHQGGTVFEINSKTGKEHVLYQFTGSGDGYRPLSGVIGDGLGHLYGTAPNSDKNRRSKGKGVVFKITIATGEESVLHSFDGRDGSGPFGHLALDSQGIIYGTTLAGGAKDKGTLYKLGAGGTFTVLHNFTGQEDGSNPVGGLVISQTGVLYGTTRAGGGSCHCGTVFELAP